MAKKSTPLIAEVISIGDEMTSGARLDTNSQWLSQQLALLGIRTEFHTTVGDRFQANVQVFRTAATRADVIISTGGLGPTQDDLTREAIAAATDRPLEFRQSAFTHIAALFSVRGRMMPERNRIQAMFPQGSREIPNPQGTAPGIDLQWPHSRPAANDEEATLSGVPRLFALPGVPAEMRQMWTATVVPRLIEEMGAGRRKIHQHVVKCFGVGESEMERRLEGLIARDQIPSVGITVSRATIALRITADAAEDVDCETMIATTRERIIQSVGEFVFGEGEDYELQHAVIERLAERGESLVVMELGAGGLAGGWLAELQRPDLLVAHLTAADRETMTALLGKISTDAIGLARVACRNAKADWGLVIEGYPVIGETEQPLQSHPVELTVYRAVDNWCQHTSVSLGGHPDIIKARIAKAGLDFLRRQLVSPVPFSADTAPSSTAR